MAKKNLKNGIQIITEERSEQLMKHGFTLERDTYHKRDELINAAAYALNPNKNNRDQIIWPHFIGKIDGKSEIERLAVAGALIAAEIDRLNNL